MQVRHTWLLGTLCSFVKNKVYLVTLVYFHDSVDVVKVVYVPLTLDSIVDFRGKVAILLPEILNFLRNSCWDVAPFSFVTNPVTV